MAEPTHPFPFRSALAGELRGCTEAEVLDACGQPTQRDGDAWKWLRDAGDGVPPGTLGDPKSVEMQFLFVDGHVAHAWIRLLFADGLDYQEVLF